MEKLALVLCSAVLVCGGCNEASDEPSDDPFFGKWSCTETRTLTFTTPAGTPDATSMATSAVLTWQSQGQISMDSKTDGGVLCRIAFTEREKGVRADLPADQSCVTSDGLTLAFKMGEATIDMTGLHVSLAFAFSGTVQDADAGAPVAATGTGTTAMACTKIVPLSAGGSSGGGW
jgi:hypothetical protein